MAMKLKSRRVAAWTVAWVMVSVGHAAGGQRALEIMREVDRRENGGSSTHVGTVEVRERNGGVSRRRWQGWVEDDGAARKMLLRFTYPPEARGTGLLTINHGNGAIDQWLYVPAIRRARRIAVQQASARFMGTDFSHEDMRRPAVGDYEYELIDDDASIDGQPAYKIRATPTDNYESQYSRQVVWVRKDIMLSARREFYVGRDLRRTLVSGDWREIQGRWTALVREMTDASSGSGTRIRFSDVRYEIDLPSDWFTLRSLRRQE